MNCRRAQSDIALWAGNDLDEADLPSLQRHLEACPECREYQEQMHQLMQLVEECPLREEGDEASQAVVEDSLWPSLSTQLVSVRTSRSDHFNGWVPAVAVAAVCLAMVLIASPPQARGPQEAPQASVSGQSEWNQNGEETGFADATPPRGSQRIQEPIQILPVRDNIAVEPRFRNSNNGDRELQEAESLFRNPHQLPRFDGRLETEQDLRQLEKMHDILMNLHGDSGER